MHYRYESNDITHTCSSSNLIDRKLCACSERDKRANEREIERERDRERAKTRNVASNGWYIMKLNVIKHKITAKL